MTAKDNCISSIRKIDTPRIDDVAAMLMLARPTSSVWLCGNGGSASTASHFAADLTRLRFKVRCMVDNPSVITAFTNDFGWNNLYVEQMRRGQFWGGDILIVASVHGGIGKEEAEEWSQNLVKACRFAKDSGGFVISLIGTPKDSAEIPLEKLADVCLKVDHDDAYVVEAIHTCISHIICSKIKSALEGKGDPSD